MVSALQAGAPIGLSATDAWDKAAAGDTGSMRPNRMNDESLMGYGPRQSDVRLRFPLRM